MSFIKKYDEYIDFMKIICLSSVSLKGPGYLPGYSSIILFKKNKLKHN